MVVALLIHFGLPCFPPRESGKSNKKCKSDTNSITILSEKDTRILNEIANAAETTYFKSLSQSK
jgi:hypothetical protein